MSPTKKPKRAGERARDEERPGGPRFGGEPWQVADEREEDERFGKARNEQPPSPYHDSTSIAEEAPRVDEARRVEEETAVVTGAKIESSAEHEGFGRGEKPRKPKSRTKPNPRAKSKKKAKKRR